MNLSTESPSKMELAVFSVEYSSTEYQWKVRFQAPTMQWREHRGEKGGLEGALEVVDRPTQLICISDIYLLYVNRQIQKT